MELQKIQSGEVTFPKSLSKTWQNELQVCKYLKENGPVEVEGKPPVRFNAGDDMYLTNNLGYTDEDFAKVEAAVQMSCAKVAAQIAKGNFKYGDDPLGDYTRAIAATERRVFDAQKCFMAHVDVIPIYQRLPTKYNSLSHLINKPSPTLTTLKVYRGFGNAISILTFILAEFIDLFQVAHKIPERHIDRVAAIIMENYFYFSLAEIKYLLYNSLKENSMHRIDVNSITVLFESYSIERQAAAAQGSLDGSNRHKTFNTLKRLKLSDEQAKLIRAYFEKQEEAAQKKRKEAESNLSPDEKKVIMGAINKLAEKAKDALDPDFEKDPGKVKAFLEKEAILKRGPITKETKEELEKKYHARQKYKRDQERLANHNRKLVRGRKNN